MGVTVVPAIHQGFDRFEPGMIFFLDCRAIEELSAFKWLRKWLEQEFPNGCWPPVVSVRRINDDVHGLEDGPRREYSGGLQEAIGWGNPFVLLPAGGWPPVKRLLTPTWARHLDTICVKRNIAA